MNKTPWRDRLRSLWEVAEWPGFVFVALLGFAFGIDGFRQHLAASGEPSSASDVLYRTLQLFVLESGWDPEGVNRELQVARLVAPVVAAYAAVQALGLGVSSGTFYGNLRSYLKAAGLPPSGVHVLRHAAAKLRRDAGESLEEVSERLGQTRTSTTTDTYAYVLPGMGREAAKALDMVLGG